MLFPLTETNRTFFAGYCLSSILAILPMLFAFIFYRKYKELLIPLVAGFLMVVAELILSKIGFRIIYGNLHPLLVILAIGFSPTFLFVGASYISLFYLFTKKERKFCKLALLLFVISWILHPLGNFIPAFGESITIRRIMPGWWHLAEVSLTISFFLLNIFLLKLYKPTLLAFATGTLLDTFFEGIMAAFGIRWYKGNFLLKFLLHSFFELNTGLMLSLFVYEILLRRKGKSLLNFFCSKV